MQARSAATASGRPRRGVARLLLACAAVSGTSRAIVDCDDDAARALVTDVLHELGLEVTTVRGRPVHLVLAMYAPGDSMLALLTASRTLTFPAPVIVLLPFWDERLARQASRLGATACHAMAAPLDELRTHIRAALSLRIAAKRQGGADV